MSASYDRTSANPIYEGAQHYERNVEGIACDCGGYADRADVTKEEELAFGCGRPECCSRAFVCRVCARRYLGWAHAPEME